MAMLVINSVTVNIALNGGVNISYENHLDRARAISGTLLVTRTESYVNFPTFSVTTTPMTGTARDTLLVELAKPFVDISGDLGEWTVSPVLTAVTPLTLPGPTRRWIVSFDLMAD